MLDLQPAPTFLSAFYQQQGNAFSIRPEQASHFAKGISQDFNPIHDAEAKRFCVPGDLLFALILTQCGLHEAMTFTFDGMVGRDSVVVLNSDSQGAQKIAITLTDEQGKPCVSALGKGQHTQSTTAIETFIRAYVAFSGVSFPDVLIPLMASQAVMINPSRPLVMYQSMSLELDTLSVDDLVLKPLPAELVQDGKRGHVTMPFEFMDRHTDQCLGRGKKSMVLSGLRPYDAEKMSQLKEAYMSWKAAYPS